MGIQSFWLNTDMQNHIYYWRLENSTSPISQGYKEMPCFFTFRYKEIFNGRNNIHIKRSDDYGVCENLFNSLISNFYLTKPTNF